MPLSLTRTLRRTARRRDISEKLERNIARLEQVNSELFTVAEDLSAKVKEYIQDD
jgi:hypothetical protein